MALVVGFALPAHAAAATTFAPNSDTSRPYQRWIDRAGMPTPDVALTIRRGWCPDAIATACTREGTTEVWLSRSGGSTKGWFSHELGHQFDYVELSERERQGLTRRMGLAGPWVDRSLGSLSPHEMFAETYGVCLLGRSETEALPFAPQRFRRVCRFTAASY